jgi:hypothetical protein
MQASGKVVRGRGLGIEVLPEAEVGLLKRPHVLIFVSYTAKVIPHLEHLVRIYLGSSSLVTFAAYIPERSTTAF